MATAPIFPRLRQNFSDYMSDYQDRRAAGERPFMTALSNNSNALLGAGSALLNGGRNAWANAFQGFSQGSQMDQAKKDRQKAEEERAQFETALGGLNLPPELAALAPYAPEMAIDYWQQQNAPPAVPDPTDDIREYEYARANGFEGSFYDWQMARPASTQINNNLGPTGPQVGTIPQSYQLVTDPETGAYRMEPIPGSPAAQEIAAADEAAGNARQNELDSANVVLFNIDRALDLAAGGFTTGFWGARVRGLEGTPAYDLNGTVDTIKANIGFEQLQGMREASPTGGALGQVTERELAFLQSVAGNLDPNQSREVFIENLLEVQAAYLDIVHGQGNWTMDENGQVQIRQPQGQQPGGGDWIDLGGGVRIRELTP